MRRPEDAAADVALREADVLALDAGEALGTADEARSFLVAVGVMLTRFFSDFLESSLVNLLSF